jgi:chromate transporter
VTSSTTQRAKPTVSQLALTFLRIGAIGFGGGMAVLSLIEREMRARKWMSEEEVLEAFAIGQSLPGAVAANTTAFIAMRLCGWLGAALSTFTFVLPSFFLMLGAALAYPYFRALPRMDPLFEGLTAAVVGIILALTLNLGQRAIKSVWSFSLAALSCGLLVLSGTAAIEVILLAGLIGIFADSFQQNRKRRSRRKGNQDKGSKGPSTTLCLLPWALILLAATGVLWDLVRVFLTAGAITFGGGFVMIPLLEYEVVNQAGWLTSQQFADAMALGQITPGPVVISATFIGFYAAGVAGAIVATMAIFFPSVLLASSAARYLKQFRTNRQVNAFLRGLAPAVLGMLLAAAISLGRAGIDGPVGLVIAGLSCAAVLWLHPNPAWVVFVAGAVRLALSALGV